MPELLLAIDQGTTNTKALLVDREGRIVFRTSEPLTLHTPQPGFVEQDPLALWTSVIAVMSRASEHAASIGASLAGIALSNQRETTLAWHRVTGTPLTPAMSWQCRRSADVCDDLTPHAEDLRRQTGLPLDPVLSATKWAWALRNVPTVVQAARDGELCFGTIDTWLVWKLTAGAVFATDHTNASRTGALDLAQLTWSPAILSRLGLPVDALPTLLPSSGRFGSCAADTPCPGVPIVAVLGDSHAALAGHGAFTPGAIKATYGTGSSLMTLTPVLATDAPMLARTVAWSTAAGTQYALEGNIFMSGAALQWVGEFLGLTDPAASAAALAATVPDAAELHFVPAMVGLGAPHWSSNARGLLCGLERAHRAAHMARAALDAIAFQVADVFTAMRSVAHTDLPCLFADGGATRNDALMQTQADLLGVPVARSAEEELSALGAAYLGGITLGWWSFDTLAAMPRPHTTFKPTLPDAERTQRLRGWAAAVRRTLQREEAEHE